MHFSDLFSERIGDIGLGGRCMNVLLRDEGRRRQRSPPRCQAGKVAPTPTEPTSTFTSSQLTNCEYCCLFSTANSIKPYRSVKPRRFSRSVLLHIQSCPTKIFKSSLIMFFYFNITNIRQQLKNTKLLFIRKNIKRHDVNIYI